MNTAITYQLDFCDHKQHLVHVTLDFVADSEQTLLWLPTWIAGSYLIREFAKNIPNVQYLGKHAKKINKNTWQLDTQKGQAVQVRYSVYCYDLSVRTAYIDHERIFGNFSSLLLHIDGRQQQPCVIRFKLPTDLDKTLAIGLPYQSLADGYYFDTLPNGKALTSFEATDFPFEIGKQSQMDFVVDLKGRAIVHRFFVSGVFECELETLKQDLARICQAYMDKLEWSPFENYTFLTYASKNDYGGLEHINSTALITPRNDLPSACGNRADYLRFLGLCSHEYFHAWWVKTIRPDVMMTSKLQQEAYTPLLWVFEGFTSYLDDFMLYQSQVIDKKEYLTLLEAQILRYLNNTGRHHQSVAESSFDTWIKLYRPDENSPNVTTSYYNKGALVAMGLDLVLIGYGKRLLDVVKHCVWLAKDLPDARLGLSEQDFDGVMQQFLPTEIWATFKACYVDGVDELPLDEWLGQVDIALDVIYADEPFGISVDNATIKRITPNSSATLAGLSANDVLVAIDNLKADDKQLKLSYTQQAIHQHTVKIHAFRRDVLMEFDMPFVHTQNVAKVRLTGVGGKWLS